MPINPRRFLLPLFIGLFLYFEPGAAAQEQVGLQLKTIVIDPGHGGKDAGCISRDGKTLEKNIVLDVGLRLGELIQQTYPDIKVIYTRSTDKFVPLDQRAAIANRNHADLFISIHVNSVKNNSSARGTETWVMGMHKSESNFEVCKQENSVIVLEEDYSSTYQGFDPKNPESYIIFSLLQNAHLEQSLYLADKMQESFQKGPIRKNRGIKQGGLLVLWKCTMPAVLTELGFMSNSEDLKALRSASQRQKMANSIFQAVKQYKQSYETVIEVTDPVIRGTQDPDGCYRIQIFASSKKLSPSDPAFKGLEGCQRLSAGSLYKYTYGRYASQEQARKDLAYVRKFFPEAFITHIE